MPTRRLIGVVRLEPTIGILQLFLFFVLRLVFRLEILFEINYNVVTRGVLECIRAIPKKRQGSSCLLL